MLRLLSSKWAMHPLYSLCASIPTSDDVSPSFVKDHTNRRSQAHQINIRFCSNVDPSSSDPFQTRKAPIVPFMVTVLSAVYIMRRYLIIVPQGVSMEPTICGEQDILLARRVHWKKESNEASNKWFDTKSPCRNKRLAGIIDLAKKLTLRFLNGRSPPVGSVVIAEHSGTLICKRIAYKSGSAVPLRDFIEWDREEDISGEGLQRSLKRSNVYQAANDFNNRGLALSNIVSPLYPVISLNKGYYWLLGDNRRRSGDSRRHGAFAQESVMATVRAIIWPIHRWTFL